MKNWYPRYQFEWFNSQYLQWMLGLFLVLSASACGFNKSGIVNLELLRSTGWTDIERSFIADGFSEYANNIRAEVARERVAFVVNNAAEEIRWASPAEFSPEPQCTQTRGIALLVHGLSDSAYSMRDVAQTLANACYIARTVLLPGHGTKPGDLLNVRRSDWTRTMQWLIADAATDHDHVIVVGFSLGAVLSLTEAIKPDSPVDAVITISPALYLSTAPWAGLSRFIHPFRRWLDKEAPDDAYRYEGIPTIAVAETVRAIHRFHSALKQQGEVLSPWLMFQSVDDLVVDVDKNRQLFEDYAHHSMSQLVTFHGDWSSSPPERFGGSGRFVDLDARSEDERVSGLSHVAIHQSPKNLHYGIDGAYRNCGSGGPRSRDAVSLCQQADELWLGPWQGSAPDNGAYGISTYNPHYDKLQTYLLNFLDVIAPQE